MEKKDKCCTPKGQVPRYVDCIGCDKKPIETMSKQTAVEWLEWQIKDIFYVAEASEMTKKFKSVYEQAKQMEKEQMWDYINKKYCIGDKSLEFHKLEFEDFYNDTYGGEDE